MTNLVKYNLKGEKIGDVKIAEPFESSELNSQLVKDYIVAIRHNARQWSASTKDRSEVKHTTKKPHPQKKTGRARQGCTVSPQYRGGGVVFGPKPKFNQKVRINKKERRQAICQLIAEKMKASQVLILEDTLMESPRTKVLASFLKACGVQGKTLFLGEGEYRELEEDGIVKKLSASSERHVNFARSLQNLPNTAFNLAANVCGYDLAWARNLVISEKALPELVQWLSR